MKWKDISSAPTNTTVIVYVPDAKPSVRTMQYIDYWKRWMDVPYSNFKLIVKPTKWMRMPDEPI